MPYRMVVRQHLRQNRGDPFIGGLIAKGIGALGKAIFKPKPFPAPSWPGGGVGAFPKLPGAIGTIARGVGTGVSVYQGVTGLLKKDPDFSDVSGGSSTTARRPGWKKNRSMNVTNVKALRRALRRTEGFATLAKKVLAPSAYKVQRKTSGRKRSCRP